MKKLFLMSVVAGLTLTAAAQETEKQVATLQHGDQTTVFYGIDAFKSAYDAAADTLDVITLSGGQFNVPSTISKSIAIYGVGCEDDATTGTQRSYLSGNINLKPADGVDDDGLYVTAQKKVNGVHIEGVYVNGSINAQSNNNEPIHNLSVVKCRVNGNIIFNVTNYDCVIRQSIVNQVAGYSSSNPTYAKNLFIANCHIKNSSTVSLRYFSTISTILVDHCLTNSMSVVAARYTNNIIYSSSLQSGSDGSNNIFITTSGTATSTTTDGSWYNMRNAGVWADENEDGTYAANKTFELKFPERYIGTDGTQIGLHGGVYTWNKTPIIPRITEFTIDTENVNNGTLKVSIKAEAQTKE